MLRSKLKQCGEKIRYKTQKKAGEGVLRYHGLDNSFCSYMCPHCKYWHIGHKIKNKDETPWR